MNFLEKYPEFKEARDYAVEKHKGQFYGKNDYSYHLDGVVNVLMHHIDYTSEEGKDLIKAAYCHDLIEDQNETTENLECVFNENVANLVWAVSGMGESRKDRTFDIIAKIKRFPKSANLKVADRITNIRASILDGESARKFVKLYILEDDTYDEVFKLAKKSLYAEYKDVIKEAKKSLGLPVEATSEMVKEIKLK